ncbi:MAG: hypothetical protein AAGG80_02260 [Pseudomonadota bacterium]
MKSKFLLIIFACSIFLFSSLSSAASTKQSVGSGNYCTYWANFVQQHFPQHNWPLWCANFKYAIDKWGKNGIVYGCYRIYHQHNTGCENGWNNFFYVNHCSCP